MVPILFIAAAFTVLLPKTAFISLEDINYMNESLEDENEESKAEKLKDSEEDIAKKIEGF